MRFVDNPLPRPLASLLYAFFTRPANGSILFPFVDRNRSPVTNTWYTMVSSISRIVGGFFGLKHVSSVHVLSFLASSLLASKNSLAMPCISIDSVGDSSTTLSAALNQHVPDSCTRRPLAHGGTLKNHLYHQYDSRWIPSSPVVGGVVSTMRRNMVRVPPSPPTKRLGSRDIRGSRGSGALPSYMAFNARKSTPRPPPPNVLFFLPSANVCPPGPKSTLFGSKLATTVFWDDVCANM